MQCEQLTFLPAPVADSWPTSYWATLQYWLWNGMTTAAKSSASDEMMDGSLGCTCTKAISGCSIHPSGRDEWIASQRASLASLTAWPGNNSAPKIRARGGRMSSETFAFFGLDSHSWKTCLGWSPEDSSVPFSGTWPRTGIMRDGRCSALRPLELRTSESAGGALPRIPTPCAGDAKSTCNSTATRHRMPPTGVHAGDTLTDYVRKYPAPKARDWKASGGAARHSQDLPGAVGGAVNPPWVEWLQRFPIGFTASRLWAMLRSRSARRQRGESSEALK
jgi:hypothetical protein